MHHAFAIAGNAQEGIAQAHAWLTRELGIEPSGNPDVIVLTYGLFSVEDARQAAAIASQAPIAGESKALVIAAARAYREAQNALLKLFEEPPPHTYLFLILPSLGGLLPTLRSRVQVLGGAGKSDDIPDAAREFVHAAREKRSAIVKKLASGSDEEARRENRDEALAIVNGIEAAAYLAGVGRNAELLLDTSAFREYLHERSAPVRMILEHLAIVTPRDLL